MAADGEIYRRGLYYPFYNIEVDQWLKAAALYWPSLVRLMPERLPLEDSATAKILIEELDFIVQRPPGESVATASERYLKLITAHGDALRRQFGLTRAMQRRIMPDSRRRTQLPLRFGEADSWPMELRAVLKGLKLDSATVAVNIRTELPAGTLLAAGAYATGHSLVAGSGAAAIGLLAMRRGLRQRRHCALAAAPVASFLLQVQQATQPRGLLDQTADRVQRIIGLAGS